MINFFISSFSDQNFNVNNKPRGFSSPGFINSEKLRKDPQGTLEKVLNFLEVDPNFNFSLIEKANPGRGIKTLFIAYLRRILEATRTRIRVNLVNNLLSIIIRKLKAINAKRGYPPIPETIKKELERYFYPYNKELESLIGVTFNWYETN